MATPQGAIASNIWGGVTYPSNFIGPIGPKDNRAGQKPAVPTAPKNTTPSGQSSAGVTNTASTPAPSFNLADEISRQKSEEEARLEAQKAQARNDISSSFDPIFSELDRQIGLLPNQRAEYETQIATLAGSQAEGAKASQEQGVKTLEGAKAQEETRAKSSIRSLAEDIRNQLSAGGQLLGSMGAGDSSATGAVSEAVTRAGLKAKSTILSGRDQAIATLDSKIGDVNSLASEQLRKIDEWKSSKLFETGQYFTNQLNQLNTAKANASAEKQKAINDIIFGLQNQFLSRVQQLDDAVINYKSSIATWQMQREAELEDYKTKLSLSSSYSGGSDNQYKYNQAVTTFNSLVDQGLDATAARNAVRSEMGIDPLAGLELTNEQLSNVKRKPSLGEEISGAIQTELNAGGQSSRAGQGLINNSIPVLGLL